MLKEIVLRFQNLKSLLQNRCYLDSRIIIFLLGFSSGVPFLLTLGTLTIRLSQLGISKSLIGLYATATIAYSFKFILATVIDNVRIPFLFNFLGNRRSWLLLTQLFLIIGLIGLGLISPEKHPIGLFFLVFLVAFFSACQDIVYEAYRIELSMDNLLSDYGAGPSGIGYEIGMLTSGGIALYIASYFNWFTAYAIMAGCMLLGVITTLLSYDTTNRNIIGNKNKIKPNNIGKFYNKINIQRSILLMKKFMISFFSEHNWIIIFLFILLYKIGGTAVNIINGPFLLEIGFSEVEIAHIAKTFGFGTMLLGCLLGGILVTRMTLLNGLLLCCLLNTVMAMTFMFLSMIGYNVWFLFFTIGIEKLSCGVGQVIFIAYLSSLCSSVYNTASYYALLSSFSSFCRVFHSAWVGWLSDQVYWVNFYGIIAMFCIVTIIFLFIFAKYFVDVSSFIVKEREAT